MNKSSNAESRPMNMEDPVLGAGTAKTATASIPVTPAGIACTAELYLSLDNGVTKAVTSSQIAFTSTGVAQPILLPVTMPSPLVGQSYTVHLIILSGGMTLGAFKATDNVIIPVVGIPVITW
jgi:hypothetical protein